MSLFSSKSVKKFSNPPFDPAAEEPALRCSICTGEQVACMRERETGKLRELMLIRSEADMESFRRSYGVSGEIRRVY